MKILVTGAAGFVASIVSRRLAANGHAVTALARGEMGPEGLRLIRHDLSRPLELEEHFDAVVHAAARLPEKGGFFADYCADNIDGMRNLINFVKTNKIPKIIYLSTVTAFGECRQAMMDEDGDIINPNFYGLTKYAGELLLREQKDIKSLTVRLPGVLGTADKHIWLPRTVARLARHEPVTVYAPDFQLTNFVHVHDLSDFIELMVNRNDYDYELLVLACREAASVREVVERAKSRLNSTSVISVGQNEKEPFRLDASRAWSMGYKSMAPLDMVDIYCNQILAETRP